jgi:hypothetical protein
MPSNKKFQKYGQVYKLAVVGSIINLISWVKGIKIFDVMKCFENKFDHPCATVIGFDS